jgi:plasmid replication initiation protein
VDYTKGLVAEMDVVDIRKLLKKEKSGSFYASLRELFSIDPHDEKSLRNSWAVMLPNADSGVLGYAEVVIACHYDTNNGKLFMKFSDEELIKSQIWQIRSEYTELPFLHMINIKSIYTYRLYEIIYSEITKTDMMLRTNGESILPNEYSFRFSLGELQFMLGILDITTDKEGKRMIASKEPDYNLIATEVNTRQRENMGEYRSFRRYSLDVATAEINNTPTSTFTISYEVEKEENGRKVGFIVFYVKKKSSTIEPSIITKQDKKDNADFIVDLARELNSLTLTYDEINRIAIASNYDKKAVAAAHVLYEQLKITDNFVDWFLELRK